MQILRHTCSLTLLKRDATKGTLCNFLATYNAIGWWFPCKIVHKIDKPVNINSHALVEHAVQRTVYVRVFVVNYKAAA